MATTEYGVNNALAVKLWAKKLYVEALKATWASKFIGDGSDNVIQKKTETNKSKGDRITIGLRMQLTGFGKQGDDTMEGDEESLVTYSDNLLINQIRNAVVSAGKMSEQRVPFSIRDEAMSSLRDWLADTIDAAFINHIAGNTSEADTRRTGNNATIAPDSTHLFSSSADNLGTTEASLSDTTTFALKLADIDRAVAKAKSFGRYGDGGSAVPIRPVMVNGEAKYVMFLHPYQVVQLRVNTAVGQWLDIQKAVVSGGAKTDNPIFDGSLGEYNGVVLHETARIPVVPSSTTRRRAVLCGAQACSIAFGMDSDNLAGSWQEKTFDYGNKLGVSAGLLYGLKKMQFNSLDFGTIVVSSYAPQA